MKTLVAGWFSFEMMGATAGDLLACEVACRWLDDAGCPFDVAFAGPFTGGVDWRAVDPGAYARVVFVCGPFRDIGEPLAGFRARFSNARFVGLDVTMLAPLESWNPFDVLLERDSTRVTRPDISFAAPSPTVPVAGLVLIRRQREYRKRSMYKAANGALERLIASRELAVVPIDTRLDDNRSGLRSAGEVEALISRMDVVLTTRLHGMVLSLKNGVPPVVVDPVAGGAKVLLQARKVGWPVVFTADDLNDGLLADALDYCLTDDARATARKCAAGAREGVEQIRLDFMAAVTAAPVA